MSLLTGQYYTIPHPSHLENANTNGKTSTRRKFFQSGARWDVEVERVLVGSGIPIPSVRVVDVGRVMEGGGVEGVPDELGVEGWDNGQEGEGEEGSMVVDT